jgi:uncharacterized protein involved in exopolysaccharide biosynthesis
MARNAIVPSNGGPPPGRPRTPVAADVIDAEFADAPRVDLREYLRILHKYRWLAATCFGLTLALSILLTLLTPRTYTATTRLQVAKQSPIQLKLEENVLSVGEDERNVAGSSSFLATQVAILKSRDLAERVIRTHRLAESDAFRNPGAGRAGLLEVSGRLLNLLRPRGWEGPTQLAQVGEGPGATEVEPELINTYLEYLGASEVRGTDLLDITFSTPDPNLSAFLAAAHTQAYIEANEEARLVTNVTAKAFLGEQLREARDKIDRAEASLRAFAAEHPSVAIDQEHKVVTQRIVELSTLLTKAEGARLALETRYEFLTHKDADPAAYFLDAAGVQKLRLALLDLDARKAAMADRIGSNHPEMMALDLQRAALAKQLDAEVKREVAAVRAKHQAQALREQRLREKVEQQELAALKLQGVSARYELLKKDVETARSLRDSLLKQQMETAVNSELAPTNVRIVDRAEVPLFAAKPNVKLNIVLGAFLGVLFAVGATLVANYFDSSVKSSEDVETLLQLPTLAIIPSFERRQQAPRPDMPAPMGARAADLVVFREPHGRGRDRQEQDAERARAPRLAARRLGPRIRDDHRERAEADREAQQLDRHRERLERRRPPRRPAAALGPAGQVRAEQRLGARRDPGEHERRQRQRRQKADEHERRERCDAGRAVGRAELPAPPHRRREQREHHRAREPERSVVHAAEQQWHADHERLQPEQHQPIQPLAAQIDHDACASPGPTP